MDISLEQAPGIQLKPRRIRFSHTHRGEQIAGKDRQRKGSGSPGFSTLELLFVIGLMAMLLATGYSVLSYTLEARLRARARMEMAILREALERFQRDHGQYPHTAGQNDPQMLYGALIGALDASGERLPANRPAYINPQSFMVVETASAEPVELEAEAGSNGIYILDTDWDKHCLADPWGQPYAYSCDAPASGTGTGGAPPALQEYDLRTSGL